MLTYRQIKAAFEAGHPVTIDGQPWPIIGHGTSGIEGKPGFSASATLGSWDGPQLHWSTQHGIETAAQRKARAWRADWESASDATREVVTRVLGPELESLPPERRKRVDRLYCIAVARLVKAGKAEYPTCNRCLGSGRHSYCEMHKDVCFGCGGSGKVMPQPKNVLAKLKAA